jgi:hypothetical protein
MYRRILIWTIPWLLGGAVLILVASTASHYGFTWDEPPYFHAADLKIHWLKTLGKNLSEGRVGESLNDKTIREAWYWNPYRVPHPPFSRFLSGVSNALFSRFIDKFVAYRLPSMLFFSAVIAVMYLWIKAAFGIKIALFTALLLILLPNLFAQAHFAMTDMPLTALWFLAAYCFWKGIESWRWSVVLGIVWGLAIATKFPALLIPVPLILWAHIYHRRSYGNNVFAMMFLGPVFVVIVNPYLWHQTIGRFVMFVYGSVTRSYRWETNFAVYFRDTLLASSDLPWYYPFFMTGITIPEMILFSFVIGSLVAMRNWYTETVMVLFLINALFIFCVGLFPGAVLHDVNRLMLPAMPFLAGLAGFGFFVSAQWLSQKIERIAVSQRIRIRRNKVAAALALLIAGPSAVDLITFHPYELSYYNRLVGGLSGAYERGLEVTYLMESFTPEFLQYLNEKLPPNSVVNASFSNFMFRYYQQEGFLRPDLTITDSQDFDYYVLLNRVSAFSNGDRAFLATDPVVDDVWRFDGVPFIYILRPSQTLLSWLSAGRSLPTSQRAKNDEDGDSAETD